MDLAEHSTGGTSRPTPNNHQRRDRTARRICADLGRETGDILRARVSPCEPQRLTLQRSPR